MTGTVKGIPLPENSDVREVYAFYGLAAYSGQVLEKALVNLMAALQTDGLRITHTQFKSIFDRCDQKTFGQLIKDARSRTQIPDTIETLLTGPLRQRNWLVHDFFADHAAAFATDSGRIRMIETLRDLTSLFDHAEEEVEALCRSLFQRRGVTQEAVARVAAGMLADFLRGSESDE